MVWRVAVICSSNCLASAVFAQTLLRSEGASYGCWSMTDATERLTCFDMALGPPVTAGSDPDQGDRQVVSRFDEAKPMPPPRQGWDQGRPPRPRP